MYPEFTHAELLTIAVAITNYRKEVRKIRGERFATPTMDAILKRIRVYLRLRDDIVLRNQEADL